MQIAGFFTFHFFHLKLSSVFVYTPGIPAFRKEVNNNMTALQQINKKILSVMVDGQSISLPEYVKRAVCTYFFDTDSFFLAKRRHICKQLYEVEQLIEENWQDIHDETKYSEVIVRLQFIPCSVY
jgi:deoxyinosine 3'endonuclease (endonuclease V)